MELSDQPATMSSHDPLFSFQQLLNNCIVDANINTLIRKKTAPVIVASVRNPGEEERGSILQQEPSAPNEPESRFVIDAPDFGSGTGAWSDQPADWTTKFAFDDFDISGQELMHYWNYFRHLDNQMKQKIAELLTQMGKGIREEETGSTLQQEPSTPNGTGSGFAFDPSEPDAFDFNLKTAGTLDTAEIDMQETLGPLFTKEETDYASLIDLSNLSGPDVLADNSQFQTSVGSDFFDL